MTAPKLSGPQLDVLRELAKSPGNYLGQSDVWIAGSIRVKNVTACTLIAKKLAHLDHGTYVFTITPAGRAYLAALDGAK